MQQGAQVWFVEYLLNHPKQLPPIGLELLETDSSQDLLSDSGQELLTG